MNVPGPIVLVGGSGLGPWAWGRVTPILHQQELAVITPQLRATGDDKTAPATITLTDWIDDLTSEVNRFDNVTLVAHSFAGYVAAGSLSQVADRLHSVIFLDAALPHPGASWFEVMGPATERFMRDIAHDGAIPWWTRNQLDQMYPEHGITQTDWDWMHERVTSQPINTYTQPAIDQPLETLARGVPLHYVRCLRTHPQVATITDDTPGWTMSTIDSSHWPMITEPELTAQRIIEVVKDR